METVERRKTERKGSSMRLLFKQRFFSWFDSYDIYDEAGSTVYTVKGQLSWGHCLHILDAYGNHIGTVQEKVFTFLPKFELYDASGYIGCISKEFTLFRPQYTIDCRGWTVEGSFLEWDYSVYDGQRQVARSPRSSSAGRTPMSWTSPTPPTPSTS